MNVHLYHAEDHHFKLCQGWKSVPLTPVNKLDFGVEINQQSKRRDGTQKQEVTPTMTGEEKIHKIKQKMIKLNIKPWHKDGYLNL